ncbi:WXG100 family type VII secretion target [Streptomyces sp. NPDC090080]|uniref:WXG100 family type VII secretion target n=1 Tax=Streptomyces sp. NPDC090080 TaxID=3365939 RepID=UPI0037FD5968
MSQGEFDVALGELRGAIEIVRSESGQISALVNQIQNQFEAAHADWQSPAAGTFRTISAWFMNSSHDLDSLLADMVRRMQIAYDNYVDAENANTRNSGG